MRGHLKIHPPQSSVNRSPLTVNGLRRTVVSRYVDSSKGDGCETTLFGRVVFVVKHGRGAITVSDAGHD